MAQKKPKEREIFGMPWQVILFILIILFMPAVISIAKAAPLITDYNNSVSNNTLYPHQDVNSIIRFNATANEAIVTWNWYVDSVAVSNNSDNLNMSWSTSGQKNVTVTGTNGGGTSPAITWFPIIEREKSEASDETTALNTSWYDDLLDSFSGSTPSIQLFVSALTLPFTSNIGNFFYLFLYGLPLVVIWIRQEKALIPAGLGIIFGAFFLGQLPESYVGVAVLFIILTVFGIIYSLYKERG